jgi:hypothetical protein
MRYIVLSIVFLSCLILPSQTYGVTTTLMLTGTIVEAVTVAATVENSILTIQQPIEAKALFIGVHDVTLRVVSRNDVEVTQHGGYVVWLPSSDKRIATTVLP